MFAQKGGLKTKKRNAAYSATAQAKLQHQRQQRLSKANGIIAKRRTQNPQSGQSAIASHDCQIK